MSAKIRVTVWNEGRHEKTHEEIRKVYPDGMHAVLAGALKGAGFEVRTATLDDDAEHGLSEKVLAETDVLTWWGHMAHQDVKDEIAARVQKRVLEGMGLIVLHSGHMSKPFLKLMGTSGALKWREIGERERIWCVNPTHPIAQGLPEQIIVEHEEMYGEFFDIPTPDELVYVSWFKGGNVFRSGCCWRRGLGKVFYFRPGHESYPTYYQKEVQQVIINAVKWAVPVAPCVMTSDLSNGATWHFPQPLEKVE
jgi:trehalose utilization protein